MLKLIVLLIIFNFIGKGLALQCYSCSASVGHNAPCENATEYQDNISRQECFQDNAVCTSYKIEYGGYLMLYRSCKNSNICQALSRKYNSKYNQLIECHTCRENLCNSSTINVTSFYLFFMVALKIIVNSVTYFDLIK